MKILNPTESDINVRIDTQTEKFVELIIYKDSRFDVNCLNTLYGDRWSLDTGYDEQSIPGDPKVFANITVTDKDGCTFSRKDYGKDAAGDVKALVSDAVKRAGFRFGIGIALYTAPKIYVPTNKVNMQNSGDKLRCFDTFCVDKITYSDDGRYITELIISDLNTDKVVFSWKREDDDARRKARLEAFLNNRGTDVAPVPEKPVEKPTEAPKKASKAKSTSETTPKASKTEAVATPVIAKTDTKAAPKERPAATRYEIKGPEKALNTLCDVGSKKGTPLKNLRPVELAMLFGYESSDEVKAAVKSIAKETDAVMQACIKRGYGDIVK